MELQNLMDDHDRAFDLMFMHGVEVGAKIPWPTWEIATEEERDEIKQRELEKLKEELSNEV